MMEACGRQCVLCSLARNMCFAGQGKSTSAAKERFLRSLQALDGPKSKPVKKRTTIMTIMTLLR